MGLKLAWTKGLTGDAKKNFEIVLRNSTLVTSKITDIIDERIQTIETKHSLSDYDTPSWSHKQAHLNGQLEELYFLKSLFNFERPKT